MFPMDLDTKNVFLMVLSKTGLTQVFTLVNGGGEVDVDHPHAKRGASMIGELLTTYLSDLRALRLSTTKFSIPRTHTTTSAHHEYSSSSQNAADAFLWCTATNTITTRLENPLETEGMPDICTTDL